MCTLRAPRNTDCIIHTVGEDVTRLLKRYGYHTPRCWLILHHARGLRVKLSSAYSNYIMCNLREVRLLVVHVYKVRKCVVVFVLRCECVCVSAFLVTCGYAEAICATENRAD